MENSVEGDTIRLRICDPNGRLAVGGETLTVHLGHANVTLVIQDAQFWWPIGYGEQPLYTVSAELLRNVRTLGICNAT